jgi:outer membrane protein assembly factor BamD
MFRRAFIALLLAASLLVSVACTNKKANNPLAHINSKQPDKILFDRAMESMKQHQFEVARITLQTLINTYPDSEFVARAKLTVGESWYQEGGSTSLAQAETEFRDFITFFPNMPEAAEAQLKIADIHYRQMDKPDRDYNHARRAEDEYRQLLLQYPDSKLADTARIRLLQVQEVLAERQYRIAKFYFDRGSLLASVARARTLTDEYPLYSRADQALYMLGQAYEQQADRTRAATIPDAVKQRLTKSYLEGAAQAYTKIVNRYPAMSRYQDARRRLAALDRPVPTPTPDMVEQNKKELASRTPQTRYERFVTEMGKHPNLSPTVRYGQPTLVDSKETDAPTLVREINEAAKSAGSGAVKGEAVKDAEGKIPENQPAPREAVNPADIPAKAPAQLNEADLASSSDKTAQKPGTSTSNAAKDNSDNSASSQKKKKKKHFKVPLPW